MPPKMVEIAVAFEKLLREAAGDPNLWIPGVGNGAMGDVALALFNLPDRELRLLLWEAVGKPGDPPRGNCWICGSSWPLAN